MGECTKIKRTKIIRDLVHGYIVIDDFIEDIINTDNFQRLRDIRQLTAQHVFPSATHNRFEHSLGVMYLSKKAFSSLESEMLQNEDYVGFNKAEYDKLQLHLITASLLHDVGHAPFSHLGEKYFQSNDKLRDQLNNLIKNMGLEINTEIFKNGSKHELMSCYVILKKFYDIIRKGFEKKHIKLNIELICRCIIGSPYKNYKCPENIIINLLNSSTIDTDKLDYLIRDAYMTGIDVPKIDTTRLFKNIMIHKNTNTITFAHRALPVIQNIIEARDNMYLWVYNHHIAVYTDFVIEYYTKNLILIHEREEAKKHDPDHVRGKEYLDKLDPAQFFSVSAIADKMVSDSDLWVALKSHLKNDIPKEKLSDYTHRVFPQLYTRKFLSPLWKTIYEFRDFIQKNVEDTLRESVVEQLGNMTDYRMRVAVAKELIKRCDLKLGEIFIVPRSNKFYSLNPESVFTVLIDGRDTKIDKLLPQKNYADMYGNVAFYVFCRKDKKEKVTKEFIDIISKPLDFDIDNISETPEWLL